MTKPVAIIGVGQTKYTSRRTDVTSAALVREAVQGALDSAGVRREELDAIVLGSAPMGFEGTNLIEKWLVDAAGAKLKPYFRIHTGGSVGGSTGIGGYYHVASGEYDLVLAVAFEKLSEGEPQYWLSVTYDPFWGRDLAAGAPGLVGMQAHQYMARYPDVKPEHFAKIAVRHRRHALRNPHAHLHLDLNEADVLNAPMVTSPLRLYDCCPTSDGACAILFASERKARELSARPAWITGAATVAEAAFHPSQDIAHSEAAVQAARKAYARAGITDPVRDLDVVELYDAFTPHFLIWSECLGLTEAGGGADFVDRGIGELDSILPINPSGGVLSSNPIGATALIRQAEAALQVMGRAGERQVPGVTRSMAHGWGGWLQFHTVMVLSAEREGLSA